MKIQSTAYKVVISIAALALMMAFVLSSVRHQPSYGRMLAETWYVDVNCTTCGEGTMGSPFRSIGLSLVYANAEDIILVAQGTYKENIFIDKPLTVIGGHAATSPIWTQDIDQNKTIITSYYTGSIGEWDGDWLGSLSVLKDNGIYRMWYAGGNEVNRDRIGYADSPDGTNWFQPMAAPVIDVGSAGAWDEIEVTNPFVLETLNGFQMWYVGVDVVGQRAIGTAFSTDGLIWDKSDHNPILRPADTTENEYGFPAVVLSDTSDDLMWYYEDDEIWLATSTDGVNWTKELSAPVLSVGTAGTWDDERVYASYVIASMDGSANTYEMWYVGEGTTSSSPSMGYASSLDGRSWTKSSSNPIFSGNVDTWEAGQVNYPSVIKVNASNYSLWYQGGEPDTQGHGRAISSDGVSWTRFESNPHFSQGRPTEWGNPVVTLGSESSHVVLEGMTITGGYAIEGGGIYMVGSSPTIRDCIVTGNIALSSSGGIHISRGSPLIENTVVSGNRSTAGWAGGIKIGEATPTISNSLIISNTSRTSGGGLVVWSDGHPVTITATAISNNAAGRAGGISVGDNSDLRIYDSAIIDNKAAERAGLYVQYSTLSMTNTFLIGNHAVAGDAGAIYYRGSISKLVNVTVADNDALENVGGIIFIAYEPVHRLEILNSILAYNGSEEFYCSTDSCLVTYSNILQGVTGEGNISVDPMFVNRESGDYHLQAESPVIDVGTSDGAPTTDFEGDPRPIGKVDMGADEFIADDYQIFLSFIMK